MNADIRKMLERAELIRKTGNMPMHAMLMADIMKFCRTNDIPGGNVFDGTASDEKLAISSEIAAGVLEFCHDQTIGSIFNLSEQQMIELNLRSTTMARGNDGNGIN